MFVHKFKAARIGKILQFRNFFIRSSTTQRLKEMTERQALTRPQWHCHSRMLSSAVSVSFSILIVWVQSFLSPDCNRLWYGTTSCGDCYWTIKIVCIQVWSALWLLNSQAADRPESSDFWLIFSFVLWNCATLLPFLARIVMSNFRNLHVALVVASTLFLMCHWFTSAVSQCSCKKKIIKSTMYFVLQDLTHHFSFACTGVFEFILGNCVEVVCYSAACARWTTISVYMGFCEMGGHCPACPPFRARFWEKFLKWLIKFVFFFNSYVGYTNDLRPYMTYHFHPHAYRAKVLKIQLSENIKIS